MITERGALHGATLAPVGDRLRISVAPDGARFALRVWPADREAVAQALGLPLPAEIGELAVADGATVACLGPDEWFLVVEAGGAEGIEARLEPLRDRCSLVDVSHREVGIVVRGSAATLALGSFCALDLDALPDRSATRTLLDKASSVLVKHDAEHYRIEVWNSFASHVWGLLSQAHNEIRLDI